MISIVKHRVIKYQQNTGYIFSVACGNLLIPFVYLEKIYINLFIPITMAFVTLVCAPVLKQSNPIFKIKTGYASDTLLIFLLAILTSKLFHFFENVSIGLL